MLVGCRTDNTGEAGIFKPTITTYVPIPIQSENQSDLELGINNVVQLSCFSTAPLSKMPIPSKCLQPQSSPHQNIMIIVKIKIISKGEPYTVDKTVKKEHTPAENEEKKKKKIDFELFFHFYENA